MLIIAHGRPSDSHATYLYYVFLLKAQINIWSPWYTSLTRLSLSSIPLFVLPSGFPVNTIPTTWPPAFVQKLTLRTPSWSNHFPASWSRRIYRLNFFCFFHSNCLLMYVKRIIPKWRWSFGSLSFFFSATILRADDDIAWPSWIWDQLFLDLGFELNVLLHLLTRIQLIGWHDSFYMSILCYLSGMV